jgi:hypothetical protein
MKKFLILAALVLLGCESKRARLRSACHLDNVTSGTHQVYKCTVQDCGMEQMVNIEGEPEFGVECRDRRTTCEHKEPDIECYICDGGIVCIEHGGYRPREKR